MKAVFLKLRDPAAVLGMKSIKQFVSSFKVIDSFPTYARTYQLHSLINLRVQEHAPYYYYYYTLLPRQRAALELPNMKS